MKLIINVVDNQDVEKLIKALNDQHFRVTRMNSTGALPGVGSSTLLIGLDDEQVQAAMAIIAEIASPHPGFFPYAHTPLGLPPTSFIEVNVGSFTTFVLDIDHFEQV